MPSNNSISHSRRNKVKKFVEYFPAWLFSRLTFKRYQEERLKQAQKEEIEKTKEDKQTTC
ncbi:hypothetical protein KKG65_03750 [Patescibacteria group bacterium]|nr:hypothetical protein [Patescibacteria group bacterium]